MTIQHNFANQLSGLCTQVKPFPLRKPAVRVFNNILSKELALASSIQEEEILEELFSPEGILQEQSVAQKYGGHQFGHWNPHLGDGRGLLLGEVRNNYGKLHDLHLKGAGPTPYSRHADGRAVLRSTIREYVASEALHALGIPSSRALALISSDEPVFREQQESGAMLIRTCPSHIRFGHFEYFYHADQRDKLDELFDFCLEHHFPHFSNEANPHLSVFTEICESTADMIAFWQAYGFNHGVMNTDNMSIHGITFDFGPYAFLDDFIPQYICNKSDHEGRYAFNQQPTIGLWNLNALAHAFSAYLSIDQLKQGLSTYEPRFLSKYKSLMLKRLGLDHIGSKSSAQHKDKSAEVLDEFLNIIKDEQADFHQSFRALSLSVLDLVNGQFDSLVNKFQQGDRVTRFLNDYSALLNESLNNSLKISDIQDKMLKCNPKFVARNHHLQNIIAAAESGDYEPLNRFLHVLKSPFDEHEEYAEYSKPPSACEKGVALSCSS